MMVVAQRRSGSDGRFTVRTFCLLAATVCIMGSLYLSYCHEPDNETVTFSTSDLGDGNEAVTSSAKTYLFQFTGDDADSVHWDFGDGTSADAFEVYKTYADAGTYNVLCTATNFGGSRVSGMPLTIEEKDFGFFTGYSDELLLLSFGIMFMVLAFSAGVTADNRVRHKRRDPRW